MPLKISLKPQEKIFIGGAVVQNGDHSAEFAILNDVPLLREKDIMTEAQVDTACKRLYLCVQLMYMDAAHIASYQQDYCRLMEEILEAAPSTARFLAEINTDLACGRYYHALKTASKLVDYEKELLAHACKTP